MLCELLKNCNVQINCLIIKSAKGIQAPRTYTFDVVMLKLFGTVSVLKYNTFKHVNSLSNSY